MDRIEHGAVIPDECVADLCHLGVLVVTRPNFIAERGDQFRTCPKADTVCCGGWPRCAVCGYPLRCLLICRSGTPTPGW